MRDRGHRFTSRCDTEVLVHLWEEFDRKMVQKLSGIFTSSIWDRDENYVFLARDPHDIKHLYFAMTDNGVVWGSEVQPLLESGVDPTIDENAVCQFFIFKFISWTQTDLSELRKIEPGSWLSIAQDGIERGRYWTLPAETVSEGIESVTSTVRKLREPSVEARMLADMPVVALLSWGVNSSAIVGLAADRDDDIDTCSIALEQSQQDEIPQLWSILVDDMSIVEPHAERPEFDEYIERGISDRRPRWFVKPGLTGLAQVRGMTGHDPEEKFRYDIDYIRNQSCWFDLKNHRPPATAGHGGGVPFCSGSEVMHGLRTYVPGDRGGIGCFLDPAAINPSPVWCGPRPDAESAVDIPNLTRVSVNVEVTYVGESVNIAAGFSYRMIFGRA